MKKPSSRRETPGDDAMNGLDLGELQFRRLRVTLFSVTFLLGAATCVLVAMLDPSVTPPQARVAFSIALLLAAVFAWHFSTVTEFHEAGVRRRSPLRSRDLAWRDITTFSLEMMSFPGDGFLVVFKTQDGGRLEIRTRRGPEHDAELMGVISALAFAEAGRMKATLVGGESVPLGPHARLTAAGLEVRGRSFGQGGEVRVVAWESLSAEVPDLGGVSFLADGERKPFLRVLKSTPGLLPALQVIRERAGRAKACTPESVTSS